MWPGRASSGLHIQYDQLIINPLKYTSCTQTTFLEIDQRADQCLTALDDVAHVVERHSSMNAHLKISSFVHLFIQTCIFP